MHPRSGQRQLPSLLRLRGPHIASGREKVLLQGSSYQNAAVSVSRGNHSRDNSKSTCPSVSGAASSYSLSDTDDECSEHGLGLPLSVPRFQVTIVDVDARETCHDAPPRSQFVSLSSCLAGTDAECESEYSHVDTDDEFERPARSQFVSFCSSTYPEIEDDHVSTRRPSASSFSSSSFFPTTDVDSDGEYLHCDTDDDIGTPARSQFLSMSNTDIEGEHLSVRSVSMSLNCSGHVDAGDESDGSPSRSRFISVSSIPNAHGSADDAYTHVDTDSECDYDCADVSRPPRDVMSAPILNQAHDKMLTGYASRPSSYHDVVPLEERTNGSFRCFTDGVCKPCGFFKKVTKDGVHRCTQGESCGFCHCQGHYELCFRSNPNQKSRKQGKRRCRRCNPGESCDFCHANLR